ncbi:hypothetical protein R1sor_023702 [Riccia sorocarpa]|uniref:Natural killer-tumor recognition protein n=1 Tax=Riccia sorocarpa TaxID=122646 RepID=A0ABD3GQ77_9MARC
MDLETGGRKAEQEAKAGETPLEAQTAPTVQSEHRAKGKEKVDDSNGDQLLSKNHFAALDEDDNSEMPDENLVTTATPTHELEIGNTEHQGGTSQHSVNENQEATTPSNAGVNADADQEASDMDISKDPKRKRDVKTLLAKSANSNKENEEEQGEQSKQAEGQTCQKPAVEGQTSKSTNSKGRVTSKNL